MAIDVQVINQNVAERRDKALATLDAIKRWPHWDEVFLNCVKESPLTYEAFASAVQAGDTSRSAFDDALVASQMTREEFERYLPEYQKYMALCKHYPGTGMLSTRVDAIWHGHMLVTDRYQEFCDQFIGRFVHHLPCSLYAIYGVTPGTAGSCLTKCVPETCKDEGGGCKDKDEGSRDADPVATGESIRRSSSAFIEAYTEVFEVAPSSIIWEQIV